MVNPTKCSENQIRVRYGETDQMGVVYHGNYAQYFEIGRTEWLRELGVTYKQMEEDGVMLPVISLNVKFKKSAYYDDVIKVITKLKKMPTATIEFDYEILNSKNEILTTGNTVLAFIDINKNRPTRCPKYILDKLQD
ncbi:acyl-CoA thioesterase [Meridianimaribacter flavus]|uniref:Acyl-CoA thioester hydrolase n=1 Tax=Meridianimaribacter flavus TaxID=571115 RepID=A0ABY2G7M8_9FLAO|nr:thioesterase family protein [Meridianimaribacter flavus]TDY12648.1 acyl-CoA thioester hydrolase [Meridianimaribacter flavus]